MRYMMFAMPGIQAQQKPKPHGPFAFGVINGMIVPFVITDLLQYLIPSLMQGMQQGD
jgi:hypothetical protein